MSGTGRTRGAYAKTAERRREIVRAGIEVFSSSGFRSGSIREIAERVGMSQAGLLHHFTNKSELLSAVLEARDDLDRSRINPDEISGLGRITALADLAAHNQTVPGLVELHCVLSAEATAPEHPAHAYFIRRYDYVVGFSTEAFTDMRDSGQLRDGIDPQRAARSLIALMDGLQVQWLLDPTSLDMAEETRAFLRSIVAPGISLDGDVGHTQADVPSR